MKQLDSEKCPNSHSEIMKKVSTKHAGTELRQNQNEAYWLLRGSPYMTPNIPKLLSACKIIPRDGRGVSIMAMHRCSPPGHSHASTLKQWLDGTPRALHCPRGLGCHMWSHGRSYLVVGNFQPRKYHSWVRTVKLKS